MLPAMVSCQLAISDSSPANGCLRVIRGSHRLGLLEHERLPWKQTTIAGSGWDKLKQLEQVDICTKAGDALFFHCQLVHCSGANTSAVPRWTLMFTYNTRANAPLADTSGHRYRPLAGVDDAWSFQQRI
jgi:ectoine hydroxylase-related dioxygenase (phytanoyl-CoA dioxygenase family)